MDTKTKPVYMLSTRDPLQTYRHGQTESGGMKKDIPCKRKSKETGVAILISDKIDFKDYYKRQIRTVQIDHCINPRRRYNNCKYLCTQHRSISIQKANANSHKRGNRQ